MNINMRSMKLGILIAVVAVLVSGFCAVAADGKSGKEKKKSESVVFVLSPAMNCSNCENRIKNNMRFEKGVQGIVTSLADQTVTVKYNPAKTNVDALVKGFKKIGYDAYPSDKVPAGFKPAAGNCKSK